MDKVRVYYCNDAENEGLALHIDPAASLMDLLNAWQPLCDQSAYRRKKYASNLNQSCRACAHNCCDTAYVIPDLIAFKKMARYTACSYESFVNQYFEAEKRAIGLLRMRPNPCVFLQDQICTIYPIRALICRFYLCIDLRGDTEEFIYHISSLGMAATHKFARQQGLLGNENGPVSSMDQLFLRLFDEYDSSPLLSYFLQAENYEDIPLQPFL
ncbi:MAG: YkgJ family cysteine cluster protein [Syntrophomonadaceae bacterium]